jgi:DNA-binding transcriptional ArsR family regulator
MKSILLETIGDTTENRIIDFLIEGRGLDYTKKDIADNCGISRPTLYKILPKLTKQGIVKPTRIIGRVQLYSLNTENEKVKVLLKLEEFLLKKSFEEISGKQKIMIRA